MNSRVMDVAGVSLVWKNMTYSGITEVTTPGGVHTGGDPYLLQTHDIPNEIGDICKYLTDNGLVSGADKALKWRMPAYPEVKGHISI